jgi:hypothetical protein
MQRRRSLWTLVQLFVVLMYNFNSCVVLFVVLQVYINNCNTSNIQFVNCLGTDLEKKYFVFLNTFKLFDFHERTWWRLFQRRVVCTKFNIYVFIFMMLYVLFPKIKGQIIFLYFVKFCYNTWLRFSIICMNTGSIICCLNV